jgi:hypothetical protein
MMLLPVQVSVLDSVPDLDLLTYLPQLLDGLMNLLSDPNREIRVAAHKCMMEFLVEIQVRRGWGAAAGRGSTGRGPATALPMGLRRGGTQRGCNSWCQVQATVKLMTVQEYSTSQDSMEA